ncbi:MAG: hypothetical protein AAGH92_05035 [Planctomycetota bacterium]
MYATYLPGENLAVDAARADRLAPATTPRDYRQEPAPETPFQPNLRVVTPYGETCECSEAPTPKADAAPGFPRVASNDPPVTCEPVVIERQIQVPIYPPATLGVMIDVFA